MTRPGSKTRTRVVVVEGDAARATRTDDLATEEPMEMRLNAGRETSTVAVTMRTPGADFELAAGFLYGEGVVRSREEIRAIRYCLDGSVSADQQYNVVSVDLAREAVPDLHSLERHFYTSSACGVCGKASIDALQLRGYEPAPPGAVVADDVLFGLPEKLSSKQGVFAATGGLHAAALFTSDGSLVQLREDVGRHNALDKLIGWALLEDRLPLHDHVVLVSGRSSFEILQKCVAAGVSIVCSVSAPSSLAVDVAREFGLTLVGFLRGRRMNVYTGPERIQ